MRNFDKQGIFCILMFFFKVITWKLLFSCGGCTFGASGIKIWFGRDFSWRRGVRKFSAYWGTPSPSPIPNTGAHINHSQ